MKDLLGGCLLAIGMLIAGATGLCMYMVTGAHWRGLSSVFQYLGGPFLVGVGMIVVGALIIGSGRRPRY
jgi:hypothetical protein